jgi:uncharacterized lipoprotein YddW (UPF0748 family)
MSRRGFGWIVAGMLVVLGADASMADEEKGAPIARTGELRGVWIHSPGYFKDWDGEMKRLKDAGINAVFLNVCDGAFGHYPSKVLPDTSGYYKKTKTDWVEVASKACRKHGLEIHAWRVDFKAIHKKDTKEFLEEGRIQMHHNGKPFEWKGRKGAYWLCPAHPKNIELEAAVMVELATTYDIDGVHMDYIRFPQTNHACFCDNCRDHFLKTSGLKDVNWPDDAKQGKRYYKKFQEAKQRLVTNVVREISERVRAKKPDMKISAAIFSSVGYARTIGQNWPDWIEKGYVDFVCPMDYEKNPAKLRNMVRNQAKVIRGRVPLYPGLAGAGAAEVRTLIERIEAAREAGGDGFLIFQYTGQDCALGGRLSDMAGSITRGHTYVNHTSPDIRFELSLKAGTLSGKAVCTTKVPGSRKVKEIELNPVIESVHGEKKVELATMKIEKETPVPIEAKLTGPSRVAVYGTIHYTDGTSRPFARRSVVFAP